MEQDESLFMCSKLYIAAFGGDTQEVAGLLEGSGGGTPAAARRARPATAAQSNANRHGRCTVQEVTGERNTVLHIAAEQGHGGLVAELCYQDSSLLSAVNRTLDTPLHCAASAGHADAVETIIRLARASVEEGAFRGILCGKNEAGDTALHLAARHGHRAAVERLVKLAPELAAERNSAGVSPLYLAVMSRSVDAVRAIVVSHGDASAAGMNSQNALHAAVLQSSEAGTSASAPSSNEPPLADPIRNDAPETETSLLTESDASVRISQLEGKILDLQQELRVQGHVARRASADEDFMLSEINKAAEQLVFARLDEEEEGKRVAHLAEVLRKLSEMSNEITFWSDPTKREAISLLQVRAQQVEDLVERCRCTLALLYDAMFPLNPVPAGIGSLLGKFGHGQEVMNFVRSQIAAGAELALAFAGVSILVTMTKHMLLLCKHFLLLQ